MRLLRGPQGLPPAGVGCALAIGNFDGLHRGHAELLARTRAQAQALSVPAAVMIFEPTPREFFAPDKAPPRLQELRDKLQRFAAVGLDQVICLRFDARLATMSAEAFIDELLLARLGARAIVVGDDFRFGAQRRGDAELLRARAHAAQVEVVSGVHDEGAPDGAERCSSSNVRDALAQADLARAERLLGRKYSMIGRVRHGLKLGRQLGMPTLNFVLRHRPALCLGVYAVQARETATARELRGVASLGVRPTIGGTAPLLEVHLFDNSEDWYGRELEIEFHHFLRAEQRFDSLEALSAQMQRDAAMARALLT